MRVPNVSIFLATVCLVTAARVPGSTGKRSVSDSSYTDTGFEETDGGGKPEAAGVHDAADKRAPAGFMGVRGKKPMDAWVSEGYSDTGSKRAPSGFFGVRGKKELDFDEFEKRAPSGFMGMRGKKDPDNVPSYYDSYYPKRAPSGFFGMRGKKSYDIDEDKRAPRSGFFGMRGKKSYDLADLDEEKRAPSSGFFGVRGKKQPGRSGFFGMRGKKYPYEFRGKFVGVRGKKVSDEVAPDYWSSEELNRLGDALDINQLMLLLTENDAYNSGRENNYLTQDYSLI